MSGAGSQHQGETDKNGSLGPALDSTSGREREEQAGLGNGSNRAKNKQPFLRLQRTSKSFGSTCVLDNVDLDVHSGEIIGLLGENGAGKSTMMNIVSGALQADSGEIFIDGRPGTFASIVDSIQAGIAFVHQELSVVGSLNVAENLFLGRMPRTALGTVNFRKMLAESTAMLTKVGAHQINPRALAGSLRAGEQQLVEIAKAAARNPKLLILDEPTSSLTPHEVAGFKDYVRDAVARGTSIIFITHRLEEAIEICDRIMVLRNGSIVAERQSSITNRNQLITDMTGKASLFQHRTRMVNNRDTSLKLEGLTDHGNVSNISFDVRAGEIFGLFGLVGAGRTEVLEMICGARTVLEGSLSLQGEVKRLASPAEALTCGISLVPEGRKLAGILPQHSVRRNGSVSSLRRYALGTVMRNAVEKSVFAEHAVSMSVKMSNDQQLITTLSGGNQQKVIFARGFMAKPKVLLLDEPTHGVDVGAKAELYEIVRVAADRGVTVIVASSEIPEIIALCDRAAVLSKGKLVRVFEQFEMNEQALLESAFSEHET